MPKQQVQTAARKKPYSKRPGIVLYPHFARQFLENNEDRESWIVFTSFASSYTVSPNVETPKLTQQEFDELWDMRPDENQKLVMYGKPVTTSRKVRAYMHDYSFAGQTTKALPLPPQLENVYKWAHDRKKSLNGCLVTWYEQGSKLGPHQDDASQLVDQEIWTFSFGTTCQFRFTPLPNQPQYNYQLTLQNGEALIMGGMTNSTHKHEVLELKEPNSRRISVTFRSFKQ